MHPPVIHARIRPCTAVARRSIVSGVQTVLDPLGGVAVHAVKAKGGHIVGEPFKIDGYPDDTVLGNVHTWVDTVLAGA